VNVAVTLSSRDYDAVLFDLDGVLTRTARVHAAAWNPLSAGHVVGICPHVSTARSGLAGSLT